MLVKYIAGESYDPQSDLKIILESKSNKTVKKQDNKKVYYV